MYLINWFDYWIFFAILYLLVLSYMDIKNKRVVDARWNYVMIGLSISLLSHVNMKVWALLGLIVASIFLVFIINRAKIFGRADIVAFAWIFWGFGMIYIPAVIIFFVLTMILGLSMKAIAKYFKQEKIPFLPVIAASFIITVILLQGVLL